MKKVILLLACFLIAACGDDGGSSSGSGNSSANSGNLNMETVLLRAGGTCEKGRYYRTLESELIKDQNNNVWIAELQLLENGQYQILAQQYVISEAGNALYRYNLGALSRSEGVWKQENGSIKLDHGNLSSLGSIDDDELLFQLSGYDIAGKTKITFLTTYKASEETMPSSVACPKSARDVSSSKSGAFSKRYVEFDDGEFLFRNTTNRWNYDDILESPLTSQGDVNFFCKKYAPKLGECMAHISMRDMKSGLLEIEDVWEDTIVKRIPLRLSMTDSFFDFTEPDGHHIHLIPIDGVRSMYLGETEEEFMPL